MMFQTQKLDLILNIILIGFNSEYNAVSIIYDNKVEKIEKNLKSYIANKIARKIINNFIQ